MTPWQAVREWAGGIDVLLQNPASCSAVQLLQLGASAAIALVALRAVAGAFALREIRRACRPVARGSRLGRIHARAAAELGLKRVPPLLTSRNAPAPLFIAGFWRPFIVLDREVARRSGDAELHVAMLHELAHFRRADNIRAALAAPVVIGAIALTAGAVALQASFGHAWFRFDFDEALPLLAFAAALAVLFGRVVRERLAVARELACDDDAVGVAGDPLLLASALLTFTQLAAETKEARPDDLASLRDLPRRSCLVDRSNIETRVRRLLDYRPPRRLPLLAAQAATLATLLFALAALITR